MKLHFLISGPIRPNVEFTNYMTNRLRNTFKGHEVIIYLCYWKDVNVNKNNIENVDYLYEVEEPSDDFCFKHITGRTIQQNVLANTPDSIEHWTPRIYKCLYGIKNLIENIDNNIDDEDIVIRYRTDLLIELLDNSILKEIKLTQEQQQGTTLELLIKGNGHRSYVYVPRISGLNSCDYFGISTYKVFKQIWYVESVEEHNDLIKKLFNMEQIVLYKSSLHGIQLCHLNKHIDTAICREFNSKDDMTLMMGQTPDDKDKFGYGK